MKKINRRDFVKSTASGIMGAALASAAPAVFTSRNSLYAHGKSRVVISSSITRPDEEAVRSMICKSVMVLTGNSSSKEGWSRLFRRNEVVGIKVNALSGRRMSSSPLVVGVLTEELIKAGLKPENIIVWDRTERELASAGFEINRSGGGVRYIGTDSLGRGGYNGRIEFAGEVGSIFSDIMNLCDAHINLPVLKDHDIAGLSFGMKNWFGAIHNPNKYHDNNCSPFVADLSTHPFIKDRLRLVVGDALLVQPHGGPAYKSRWAVEYNSVLMSTDPVAIDSIGLDIIDRLRKTERLESLKDTGRYPKYLPTAEKYRLGNFDLSNIDKIEVTI
jgi:uncharacterized protein (DUF362 family)